MTVQLSLEGRFICLQSKKMSCPNRDMPTTAEGPCVGMDTACSSSLVATHLAHRGLLDGETSAAISCGVNLMLVASTSTNLAALGSLSSNGRSKTFDATADGYGRGEGCIALVMNRAEGRGCHAIMQGTLLNVSTKLRTKEPARTVPCLLWMPCRSLHFSAIFAPCSFLIECSKSNQPKFPSCVPLDLHWLQEKLNTACSRRDVLGP